MATGQQIGLFISSNSSQDFQKLVPPVVYILIDTSGSMAGSKISQVITSLVEIISNAPGHVKFVVRCFNTQLKTVVSISKNELDVKQLMKDIENSVQSLTSLYDAMGQTIREIDFDDGKKNMAELLVFTDGEDNSSSQYNLAQIVELINEEIKWRRHCTFIQAGSSHNVLNALRVGCSPEYCSVISVEDSVNGIRLAFDQVTQNFNQMFLQIQIKQNCENATGLSQNIIGLNLNSGTIGAPILDSFSLGINRQLQPTQISQCPELKNELAPFVPTAHLALQGQLPQTVNSSAGFDHKIWVGNLPKNIIELDVFNCFKQWGKCKVERLASNPGKSKQYAIVSYNSEPGKIRSIQHGNNLLFKGQNLIVKEKK